MPKIRRKPSSRSKISATQAEELLRSYVELYVKNCTRASVEKEYTGSAAWRPFVNPKRPQSRITDLPKLCAFFQEMGCFRDAVLLAALGTGPLGSRHMHQAKVRTDVMLECAKILTSAKNLKRLQAAISFQEIYTFASRTIEEVLGNLTPGAIAKGQSAPVKPYPVYTYDLAFRIGCHMNIYPTEVFLKAGTTKGLKNLFRLVGMPWSAPETITPEEVLKVAQSLRGLKAAQPKNLAVLMEDFFCIFHEELARWQPFTEQSLSRRPDA